MKQVLLAAGLIVLPVAIFAAGYRHLSDGVQAAAAQPSLGDLSALGAIAADTQAIAQTGDLVAAERRITDFESAWDAAEPTLRPLNAAAWGAVDTAADGAISALRADSPDQGKVTGALAMLAATLADPYAGISTETGAPAMVAGIAVQDASGHAIPCEEMLKDLRAALGDASLSKEISDKAAELQSKATERCNADDDKNADAFTAQGLALIRG